MEVVVADQPNGIVIVAPRDRVDAFSAPTLRERLDQLLAGGATRFVVDLSAVPFLDSTGLAVLVSLFKTVRPAGGNVVLVWPKAQAPQRILQLTKFDRVFTLVDSAEVALEAFGAELAG